ncbi:MAG TPA: Ig-like domain-containing protein [Candidatus Thermoplasmatota archaeon]|nr:Ig-like domain-containing protein [Candidatus Thermoplasmatota archaeon]
MPATADGHWADDLQFEHPVFASHWTSLDPTSDGDSWFGYDVAVAGNWTFVSDPGDAGQFVSGGEVHVFHTALDANGTLQTKLRQRLAPSPGADELAFGLSLLHAGDRLFVGTDKVRTQDGQAYEVQVFTFRLDAQGKWVQEARLATTSTTSSMLFAGALAATPDGDTLAIGYSYVVGTNDVYKVDIFQHTGTNWVRAETLTRPGGMTIAYGASLAFGDGYLAIGGPAATAAPAGSSPNGVAVYRKQLDGWKLDRVLKPVAGVDADSFGADLLADGSDLYVGVPGDTAGGETAVGSVALFRMAADGGWTAVQVLRPGDNAPYGSFGSDIELAGTHLVVSAPTSSYGGVEWRGRVHVFSRCAGGWEQTGVIDSEPATGDFLGHAMASDGSRLVVAGGLFDPDPRVEGYLPLLPSCGVDIRRTTIEALCDPDVLDCPEPFVYTDGHMSALVVLTLYDIFGDPIHVPLADIKFLTSSLNVQVSETYAVGDGRYYAWVTATGSSGATTIRATYSGDPIVDDDGIARTATIALKSVPPPSPAHSLVVVDRDWMPANPLHVATVTLYVRAADGWPVDVPVGDLSLRQAQVLVYKNDAGKEVVQQVPRGTLTSLTRVGFGTYVAEFIPDRSPGEVRLEAKLAGAPFQREAVLMLEKSQGSPDYKTYREKAVVRPTPAPTPGTGSPLPPMVTPSAPSPTPTTPTDETTTPSTPTTPPQTPPATDATTPPATPPLASVDQGRTADKDASAPAAALLALVAVAAALVRRRR